MRGVFNCRRERWILCESKTFIGTLHPFLKSRVSPFQLRASYSFVSGNGSFTVPVLYSVEKRWHFEYDRIILYPTLKNYTLSYSKDGRYGIQTFVTPPDFTYLIRRRNCRNRSRSTKPETYREDGVETYEGWRVRSFCPTESQKITWSVTSEVWDFELKRKEKLWGDWEINWLKEW